MSFAVIRTGGKQYRVSEGQNLRVEKIEAEVGSEVDLGDVLMFRNDDKIVFDRPTLSKLKVRARIVAHGRGVKIKVFTFKRRKGFHRTKGHRQDFTEIQIRSIA